MTRELYDILSQVEAAEQLPGGGFVGVHVLVGTGVPCVKVQSEVQQLLEPPLVKHAHQIWKCHLLSRVEHLPGELS